MSDPRALPRLGDVEHWFCPACGTFDGPIVRARVGLFCDVCADGSEAERMVVLDDVLAFVRSWGDSDLASPQGKLLAGAFAEAIETRFTTEADSATS